MRTGILTSSVSRSAGGLFDCVRRMGQSLQEQGVEVNVLSIKDKFTAEDVKAWLPIAPVTFGPLPPYAFSYAPGFARELAKLDCDLIHLQGLWMYPSAACFSWARRTKRPHMISAHGMLDPWAVSNSGWKKAIAGLFFEKRNLKQAECIHALCEPEMISIRQYGLKNPVCVIPNGIDLPRYANEKLASPWPETSASGRKILLYLGRIHPKKGIAQLLRGWAMAQKWDRGLLKNWAIAVAGWDQHGHEDELKALATCLQIDGSVLFIGPQFNENKAAAYKNADAFVLPSFSEGLPMVVLEAWAHGLPVLMTPECNLPEGFRAVSAIKVSTEPEDIAAGLLHLFSLTDKERKEIGARGLELVKNQFAWSKIALDMKKVYEWLLGGNKPGCVAGG